MRQLTDVSQAWRRLREHFGVGPLIGLVVVLVILLGALNEAITGLSGQNVAVDFFHWLIPHLAFLLSPLTIPIWLVAALSLLVLALTATAAILSRGYRAVFREKEQAAEDVRQWKARTHRETQKKNLLGKTLEQLELTTYSIVKTMETVVAGEQEIEKVLLDPSLSDSEKANHLANLHQPIEGVLNRLLGVAIVHAQDLVGKPSDMGQEEVADDNIVYRGGILVPVSPDTPYLVRRADSGWGDQERDLLFYIRYHERNFLDKRSVGGAAYRLKQVQECHWDAQKKKFSHEEFSHLGAYSPDSEPHKSFIAYPLQADRLFLTEEADKRVLGVLCLDSTNPHTFEGSPLLNQTSPQDVPVIRIMRVMYYLLQWRERARAGSS